MATDGKDLQTWIDENSIGDIVSAQTLVEFDFTGADTVVLLPDNDLQELCKELGLKFGKKGRFLAACQNRKEQILTREKELGPPSDLKERPKQLDKFLGGDTVFTEIQVRHVRLNIMIAGEAGLGKTTFLQSAIIYEKIAMLLSKNAPPEEYATLFELSSASARQYMSDFYEQPREIEKDGERTERVVALKPLQMFSGDPTIDLSVRFIDTPGYADGVGGVSYIKEIDLLARDVRMRMNRHYQDRLEHTGSSDGFEDIRVHMIFLFLRPRIKECDRYFWETLSKYAPIIPIAAQADHMDEEERGIFRDTVKRELRFKVDQDTWLDDGKFFNFERLVYDPEPKIYFVGANWRLKKSALESLRQMREQQDAEGNAGSDDLDEQGNPFDGITEPSDIYEAAFSRKYPWGNFQVLNPEHSDFRELISTVRKKAHAFDKQILEPKFKAYIQDKQNQEFDTTQQSYVLAKQVIKRFTKWQDTAGEQILGAGAEDSPDASLYEEGGSYQDNDDAEGGAGETGAAPAEMGTTRGPTVPARRRDQFTQRKAEHRALVNEIKMHMQLINADMTRFREFHVKWRELETVRNNWDSMEGNSGVQQEVKETKERLKQCRKEMVDHIQAAEVFEERKRVGTDPRVLLKEWGAERICERYQRTLEICMGIESKIGTSLPDFTRTIQERDAKVERLRKERKRALQKNDQNRDKIRQLEEELRDLRGQKKAIEKHATLPGGFKIGDYVTEHKAKDKSKRNRVGRVFGVTDDGRIHIGFGASGLDGTSCIDSARLKKLPKNKAPPTD